MIFADRQLSSDREYDIPDDAIVTGLTQGMQGNSGLAWGPTNANLYYVNFWAETATMRWRSIYLGSFDTRKGWPDLAVYKGKTVAEMAALWFSPDRPLQKESPDV